MRSSNLLFKLLIPAVFALFVQTTFAQSWKNIILRKSTCEDVKKELGVGGCKYPVSDFSFDGYAIAVTFAKSANSKKTAKPTVVELMVLFRKMPVLKDFEPQFAKFKVVSDDDVANGKLLKNESGVTISVQNPYNEELELGKYIVTSVRILPVKTKKK